MQLDRQAAMLKRAAHTGFLDTRDVLQWTDATIAQLETVPPWLAELATLRSERMEDFLGLVPQDETVSTAADTDIAWSCYAVGRLNFVGFLRRAFEVLILDAQTQRPNWAQGLIDLLFEWDHLEDLRKIPADLRSRLDSELESIRDRFSFVDILKQIHAETANNTVEPIVADRVEGSR